MSTPTSRDDFRADLEAFMAEARQWLTSENAPSTGAHAASDPVTQPTFVPAPAPDPIGVPAPTLSPGQAPTPTAKPGLMDREPVVIAQSITMVLGALVTAGWLVVPDTTVTIVASVVAFVLSGVMAIVARARVAPVNSTWLDVASGVIGDLVRSEMDKRQSDLTRALRMSR